MLINKTEIKFIECFTLFQASKDRALQPYTHVADLTVSTEEYFDPTHDFPKRPLWDSSWTRARYVS